MNDEAQRIVRELGLAPLPHEGGFFRQTWRTAEASAILFLVTESDFSALHRIAQDELWHFHAGDPVEHVRLHKEGAQTAGVSVTRLGGDVLAGETPQLAVPRATWQGARLARGRSAARGFALLGCTVTPPWDDRGFELGHRDALQREFPDATPWIHALTR